MSNFMLVIRVFFKIRKDIHDENYGCLHLRKSNLHEIPFKSSTNYLRPVMSFFVSL